MNELADLTDLTKVQIMDIEAELKTMPQVDCPVQHYQIEGVYGRSMFIPAGTLLTGKIHNYESIAILAHGSIRICNGEESYIISAPHIMVDNPGVKRLGYAETDVTFITIHRTDLTEIKDVEDELVSDTYEQFAITQETTRKLI